MRICARCLRVLRAEVMARVTGGAIVVHVSPHFAGSGRVWTWLDGRQLIIGRALTPDEWLYVGMGA